VIVLYKLSLEIKLKFSSIPINKIIKL